MTTSTLILLVILIGCLIAFRRDWISNSVTWLDTHDGLMTALATVAVAVLTYFLVTTSNQQGHTMQKELELSERPWIEIDISLVGPLIFDKTGVQTTVRADLRNVGHSVAVDVRPSLGLFSFQHLADPREVASAQKRICAERGKEAAGLTIFPDQQTPPLYYNPMMDAQQIEAGILKWAKPPTKVLLTHILGCVQYRAVFGTTDYQTGFNYILAQPDPDRLGAQWIQAGVNVPLDKLRLFQPFPEGLGSYAY